MRYLLLCSLLTFLCTCVRAQCPTNLTITTDAQAMNFPREYPNCTKLPGDLMITGAAVTDVSSLIQLTEVGGNLELSDLQMSDVTGLEKIETVGGDLTIRDCPKLSGDGFPNGLAISEIDGFLSLNNLPELTAFPPLINLGILSSGFGTDFTAISNFAPLSNLSGSMATLEIGNNDNLTSLSALDNVTSIGSLEIVDNSRLSNCAIAPICAALTAGNPATISGNQINCASVAAVTQACNPPCDHPDFAGLMAFYRSTDGPNWTNNTGWAAGLAGNDCDPCSWFGVTCNSDDRVTRISLLNNNLGGGLPPSSFTSVTELERLSISLNAIGGGFPSYLWSMAKLEQINMQDCNLSGTVPTPGNVPQLKILDIGGNNFTGSAPRFTDAPQLTTLLLFRNSFSGFIPLSYNPTVMPALTTLAAQSNNMTGALLTELGDYRAGQLSLLRLDDNDLEGCYPPSYASLCTASTNFSGNTQLPDDGSAAFFANNFCGTGLNCDPGCHPDYRALSDMYRLLNGENWVNNRGWMEDCDVCSWERVLCNFSGRVRAISLGSNNLSGTLPTSLGEMTSLQILDLPGNNIIGRLPASLSMMTNLTNINLQGNSIISPLPALEDLTSLIALNLGSNDLSGDFPSDITQMTSLERFSFDFNELSGPVPDLSQLTNLIFISITGNNLTGDLPVLGQMPDLEFLNVGDNMFSGNIPKEYNGTNLPALLRLDARNNDLSGELPEQLATLSTVTQLWLGDNDLEGCYPPAFHDLCAISTIFTNNDGLPDGGSAAFFTNTFCPTDPGVEGCAALPVVWRSFTARAAGKTVNLQWATSSETDNEYFAVERSRDGTDWQTIGRVNALATGVYGFQDAEVAPGDNLYRLRQVDFDGTASFSEVRRVTLAGHQPDVWPNPASNALTLFSPVPDLIQVYDLSGREVLSVPHSGGGAQVQAMDLKQGVYVVRFVSRRQTVRLVVR